MEYEIKNQNKFNLGIKELWEYKELFYFFTWRDVKVKYKQTILGVAWAIIQPLFLTIIFTQTLGTSISNKSNLTIPYPIFAISGLLLWGIFSSGMSNAANSMIANANIIKKIYFPRLIIPISSVLVAFIDFIIAFFVFILFQFFYSVDISYNKLFLLPFSVIITSISAMGCGMFLAALNVKYRDVRYVIPFFIQGLLFLTPIMYPHNISENKIINWVLSLNPISGAMELMRGIFEGYNINYNIVFISGVTSLFLFVIGIIYFRKTEHYFADLA